VLVTECFPDDRFILKQMSRYEVQSFMDFAPHYFSHVTKAFNEKVSFPVTFLFPCNQIHRTTAEKQLYM